jgi:hypothetical protein
MKCEYIQRQMYHTVYDMLLLCVHAVVGMFDRSDSSVLLFVNVCDWWRVACAVPMAGLTAEAKAYKP